MKGIEGRALIQRDDAMDLPGLIFSAGYTILLIHPHPERSFMPYPLFSKERKKDRKIEREKERKKEKGKGEKRINKKKKKKRK